MYVRVKLNGLNSVFLFGFGVRCDKNNCKRGGLGLEIEECDRSWKVRRRSENDGTSVLVYKIIKNKNLNLKIIPSKKMRPCLLSHQTENSLLQEIRKS